MRGGLFQFRHKIPAGPFQFLFGKTELKRLAQFLFDQRQRLAPVGRLAVGANIAVTNLAQEDPAAHTGIGGRRVGLADFAVQSILDDLVGQVFFYLADLVRRVIPGRGGVIQHLQCDRSAADLLFMVVKGLQTLMVNLADIGQGLRRRTRRHTTELLFNKLTGQTGGHVADHDQHHVVGSIPGVVKRFKHLTVGRSNDFLGSDGKTLRKPRTRQLEIQRGHIGPVVGGIAGALFGQYHTPLAFDLRRKQQRAFGIVLHHLEGLLETLSIGGGQVDVVNRIIKTCAGIGVGTELHANSLKIFDQFSGGEMG